MTEKEPNKFDQGISEKKITAANVIRKFDLQFPQVAQDEAKLGEYGHRGVSIEEKIDKTKAIYIGNLIDDFENKKEIFVKAEDQESNVIAEEKMFRGSKSS